METYQEIPVEKSLVKIDQNLAVIDYRTDESLSEEEKSLRAEAEQLQTILSQANLAIEGISHDLRASPRVSGQIEVLDAIDEAIEQARSNTERNRDEVARLRAQIDRLRTGRTEQKVDLLFDEEDTDDERSAIQQRVDSMRGQGANEEEVAEEVTRLRGVLRRNRELFAEVNERVAKGTRNHRRICKALYQKISARTHPDKTSDVTLNEMFIEAKMMYDRLDMDGLKEVWDALKGGGTFKRSRLRAAIQRLRDRVAELANQLAAINASPILRLIHIANEQGLSAAQNEYSKLLESQTVRSSKMLNVFQSSEFHYLQESEKLRKELIKLQELKAAGIDIQEYKDDDAPEFLKGMADEDADDDEQIELDDEDDEEIDESSSPWNHIEEEGDDEEHVFRDAD